MQSVSPESPEARLKRRAAARAHAIREAEPPEHAPRWWKVLKRVAIGVYSDGFIHAGNLAYMAILSIFPFVIVAAAITRLLLGDTGEVQHTVDGLLRTFPPTVRDVLRQPISDVLHARSGNLLWLGGLVGLWTTASFIETIRDIIRRAYGVTATNPFWEYRLLSMGFIIASIVIAMVAFSASIALSSFQQFLVHALPSAGDVIGILTLLRIVQAVVMYGALYLAFYVLTPKRYRLTKCPKWPGAALVTIWWVATTALLPVVLSSLGRYDLTYGSLAGVAIALLFFFIIGLGMVVGAELNAALAETPTPTQEDILAVVHEEAAHQAERVAQDKALAEADASER